jgi:hypothetical protein
MENLLTGKYLSRIFSIQYVMIFFVIRWACGVTFYECWTGVRLIQGKDKETVYERILRRDFDISLLKPRTDLHDLVSKFLENDQNIRMGSNGVKEIKIHPFFQSVDWITVSTSFSKHRPQQYLPPSHRNSKLELNKELFYGDDEPFESLQSDTIVTKNKPTSKIYNTLKSSNFSRRRRKSSRTLRRLKDRFSSRRNSSQDISMESITEIHNENERSDSSNGSEYLMNSSQAMN